MSRLNDVMKEAEARLSETTGVSVNGSVISLKKKVKVADSEDDLLDVLKGVMSYPAAGILYEGMRSQPEQGLTAKVGVSAELVLAFVLVAQGKAIHATDEKRIQAIDYLDAMRDQFMGERSTVTGHYWHFMVESLVELSGMICWVQRWSLPIQLPPKKRV